METAAAAEETEDVRPGKELPETVWDCSAPDGWTDEMVNDFFGEETKTVKD